tara:strand:+ start:765 stop:971 length:207 start_codon:yes stop_codon:yes gene_type:complete
MTKTKTKITGFYCPRIHAVVYKVDGILFDNFKDAELYAKDIDEGLDKNGFGIPDNHPDTESPYYNLDK